MSVDPASEVKVEIGHVLYVDIVGYSRLLIHEQSDLVRRLKEIVRGTEQVRQAESEGKLLQLPTGDGTALVFRNTVEAPVQCALEISEALKNHPDLQVRMGVHSGPVNEVADVNERANIAGAGINIAQRIMDCGDAGHILVSKHVAEDLENYARWRTFLHELGECEVKHGLRITVANLYTPTLGNPRLPRKFKIASRRRALLIAAVWLPQVAWLSVDFCAGHTRVTSGRTHQCRLKASRCCRLKISAGTRTTPTLPTVCRMKFLPTWRRSPI
jgi:class 3 adenylate cyclase